MERVPESVELMLCADQAHAYGTADLSRFNRTLIEEFQRHFGKLRQGRVLDLGCGTADIAVRLAAACPDITVVGIDGSPAMLELGRGYVQANDLAARVELRLAYLPHAGLEIGRFDAVVANSLLHHLADPADLWRTIRSCAQPGAPVMVVDLIRPADPEEARALVEMHAGRGHPLVQQDFFNSLCAAYTVEEVRHQLHEEGLTEMQVEAVSALQLKAWGIAA